MSALGIAVAVFIPLFIIIGGTVGIIFHVRHRSKQSTERDVSAYTETGPVTYTANSRRSEPTTSRTRRSRPEASAPRESTLSEKPGGDGDLGHCHSNTSYNPFFGNANFSLDEEVRAGYGPPPPYSYHST